MALEMMCIRLVLLRLLNGLGGSYRVLASFGTGSTTTFFARALMVPDACHVMQPDHLPFFSLPLLLCPFRLRKCGVENLLRPGQGSW